MADMKSILAKLTLEEKASLCSGFDFWRTKGIERLSIPSVMMSDGPHGLRKQEDGADHLGIHDSITAVCFPAACATACSFDRELLNRMGETLGDECVAERVSVLLGPAVNIKRSPLCGRNFEYFSEDPYLAGELASVMTQGIQSRGVGVSVKHFAANNQETRRMTVSAQVSERALREIYYPAFETVVKRAQPKTIMCSYNRINGVYASESHQLLTEILREEWGFDGFVVSDWFAVSDRVKGLSAGLDLEMPGGDLENDTRIVAAVKDGSLDESVLDTAVARILEVVLATAPQSDYNDSKVFDRAADHKIAADIEKECAVLLKNDRAALPLQAKDKVLMIGEFAERPRFQGGGSSHIHAYETAGAYAFCEPKGVRYEKGFSVDGTAAQADIDAALAAARTAEKVVVFAGLPDSYESEGYDRVHMRLPDCQNELIAALIKQNARVIVVLHNGAPIEMPWLDGVDAVLEMYLGGEGVGEACAALLYADANPCGRLAETFPKRVEDNPSYLNFPGDRTAVNYAEDIFVGYRYYDKKRVDVLFPFGYGLSYTTFSYGNATLSSDRLHADECITVSVDVTNTGTMRGKEVVQLYVADLTDTAVRPLRELKGFEKVDLLPNETKTVTMTLDRRAFSHYDEKTGDWYAASGEYRVLIARHARDEGIELPITIESAAAPLEIDDNTTVEQLMSHPSTRALMQKMLAAARPQTTSDMPGDHDRDMMRAAYLQAPLRTVKRALNLSSDRYGALLGALRAAVKGGNV